MSVVELVGGSVVIPGFAHDEDVVTTTERIGEDGNRAEVDVRVIAGSLTARGAVEIPFGKLLVALDWTGQSLFVEARSAIAMCENVVG